MSLFTEEEMGNPTQYRVLARKYRPQNFTDMIGQEVLVKTFTNAIKNNRVAHAFLLTGIRGVGKTTTARIIARALNCIGPEGTGSMTAEPCGICANCKAIMEDNFHDVIEIDAASHTGVNDIREIIESVRYKPISGRYKVFIIDEVHMLSSSAFNALLKTLEEPPSYVKFIFATTEIRKIPLTILSRCQRFDLKRVDAEVLTGFFQKVLEKEGFSAELNALKLIATVAAGSVRDGLSILDQAISNSTDEIKEESVRDMLGLADNTRLLNLYDTFTDGKTEESLTILKELYDCGADPILVAQELLNINHMVIKAKAAPRFLETLPDFEKNYLARIASLMDISVLSRIHSQIIKGIEEIKFSHIPNKTLEVLIVRIIHSAALPSLEQLITQGAVFSSDSQKIHAQPLKLYSFDDILNLLKDNDEIFLATQMTQDVAFVKLEGRKLYLKFMPNAQSNLLQKISTTLKAVTAENWEIIKSEDETVTTIHAQEKKAQEDYVEQISKDEGIQSILSSFTGAEIADITNKKIS